MNHRIGIVWDPIFLKHETGTRHPENPERLLSIKASLDAYSGEGELIQIRPQSASEEDLLRVHSRSYIQTLSEIADRGTTHLDADTPVCADSYEVAKLAAGGCIELVRKALTGSIDAGFAFPRPPGHHAERERAMGFCLINNVAVAAAWAIEEAHLDRIAVVDFDVHHGNGTQWIFYDRRDVLYASTHRSPFYPGSGAVEEIGDEAGEGFTVNVPLPAGSGDAEILAAYEHIICPIVTEFAPQLLIISAGFDIHVTDPLGGMKTTTAGIQQLARLLHVAPGPSCKIIYVLEGGYSDEGLRDGTTAILDELAALPGTGQNLSLNEPPSYAVAARVLPEVRMMLTHFWACLSKQQSIRIL